MKSARKLLFVAALAALTLTANAQTPPEGMALIPGGSFTMGDTLDGWGNAIPVTVNVSAFYMDKYDVTKAMWDGVYVWAITNGYSFDNAGWGKATNHPVHLINWYDAVKWCNARSEKEGRTPAYYTDAAQTAAYRTGTNDLQTGFVDWRNGYRLPTEAEWEKAARGGFSGQRFPWGNTISGSQANYNGSIGGYDLGPPGFNATYATGGYPYTSPVGSFGTNGYGLYDMAGNVWQWCWDWYGTPYAGGTDPRGATPSTGRVIRCGGWQASAVNCRVANRQFVLPTESGDYTGFRSVLGGDSGPCTPHRATAAAQVVNGLIVGATITGSGCGYTNAPVVLIQGGGGSGATATAVVSHGVVIGINITSEGFGYTSMPEIVIASPPFEPTVSISVSRVNVRQHVTLGRNYVLESSTNLLDWVATGPLFTAQSEDIINEFLVGQTGQFFRLRQVP